MRFEILGPIRIRTHGTSGAEVAGLARRELVVLAVLLLQANRTVPAGQLVDAVWDARPPAGARNQIQGCVSRIRRRLGPAGAATDQVVVTDPDGYRATVDQDQLDLVEFRQRVDRARVAAAAGDRAAAVSGFRSALSLWRGPALAGVDSSAVRRAAAALDEERAQAQVEVIELELAAGAADRLVPELTELLRDQPYRERLLRALMLAQHRAGRRSEALGAYERARQRLHDELGIEPGTELQQLNQAILDRDPELGHPAAAGPLAPAPRPVPRELPADVVGFTGRADSLQRLDELCGAAADPPGPVVISAIAGTAGVGKTALAVHWAHQAVDRFPDGQLYVNLRGYDPEQQVAPADALAGFLLALGVSSQDIPVAEAERATRFRSEATGRRLLVVLDNAGNVEQVGPLLPGSGSCSVLVTSRDTLAGLAQHGARRLDLDLLRPEEAMALLRRLIGARVDAEPAEAATLAERCARLPLALRVAAELAASRPEAPLADLVAELADRHRRLELLDADGDPYAAVREVFSWSVRHLPADAVRLFGLLGLHPGPDLDAYAAAALAGTSLELARRGLDQLTQAHLVQPAGPGRYAMHDLLRAYAIELARAADSGSDSESTLRRLFDYYLGTAAAAMDVLFPAEASRRPRVPAPATPAPELSGPDAALAWLDNERPCLVASVVYTADNGWIDYPPQLASTLHRYLIGGHYQEALIVHSHACEAAGKAGDLTEQARALVGLGSTHRQLGRYDRSNELLGHALALFRQTGDLTYEAGALTDLGIVAERLGQFVTSCDYHEQAWRLSRQVGDRRGEAMALINLATAQIQLGLLGPATDNLTQALDLFHQVGDQLGVAHVRSNLCNVEASRGRYRSALSHCHHALKVFRRLGDRAGEARALANVGAAYLAAGQPKEAARHFRHAVDYYRQSGDRDGEAWPLNGLGDAALATGRPSDAVMHYSAALTAATSTDIRDQQARAYAGLGRAHQVRDPGQARAHLESALALYTELGMPEAEEVRGWLADLPEAEQRAGADLRP